jgi:anti-sigma B factor antagonist
MSATHENTRTIPSLLFHVDVEPDRDAVRVRPTGELDLATAGQVRERIAELVASGFQRLVIDLRPTTFIDSTGLRLLLETDAAAKDGGWELAVVDGPPAVRRAFDITGLRPLLPFAEEPWL